MIRGERVFLRPFERTDADTYRRWRSDAGPMDLAGYRTPLSSAQVEQRIEELASGQDRDEMAFAICLLDGDRPIGEASLFSVDRTNGSAELGIFIGEPDEWSRGYGTDAVRTLVAFAFRELRLERVQLAVWTENVRAIRAYEKAGFVHEGTLRRDRFEHGQYTDGHVMSILRDEWRPPARVG